MGEGEAKITLRFLAWVNGLVESYAMGDNTGEKVSAEEFSLRALNVSGKMDLSIQEAV